MPYFAYEGNNTLSNLTAQDSKFIPELWSNLAQRADWERDFFAAHEDMNPNSICQCRADFSVMKGRTINMRTDDHDYYGDGVMGETIMTESEDEQPGSFPVSVDFYRDRGEYTAAMQFASGMASEINDRVPQKLGGWLGWKKSKIGFMMLRDRVSSEHTFYAGSATSIDTIKSADTITVDDIAKFTQVIKRHGANPLKIINPGEKRNVITRMGFISTNDALTSLVATSDYKDLVTNAGERGNGNVQFSGGFVDLAAGSIVNRIYEVVALAHANRGPIGSPLQPEALLGTAISAGTTAISVTGGGNATNGAITKYKYFQFFRGCPFYYSSFDLQAAGVDTYYFLIINMSGADAGKVGMYSYTGSGFTNSGNAITITNRLGSAASGARVTTLGNVTWNTGVWLNKHTDAHPSGSLIVQCNSYGVPICASLPVGGGALLRAYGGISDLDFGPGTVRMSKGTVATTQKGDGGFLTMRYIASCFGHALYKRTGDSLTKNSGVVWHAYNPAGVTLPVVS